MRLLALLAAIFFTSSIIAQSEEVFIVSGPVSGHQTDSSAIFWILVTNNPDSLSFQNSNQKIKSFDQLDDFLFKYAVERNLDAIFYNRNTLNYINNLSTLKINLSKGSHEYFDNDDGINKIKSPKEFSFLIGSCLFPFPYKSLGNEGRYEILKAMKKKNPDFMIWMGDNVYYLDKEFDSYEKMFMKNVKMRTEPAIDDFMTSCPQYAIWDDHDYGPNNSDGTNPMKDSALVVFKQFWPNANFGTEKYKGVFHHFNYEDADFFMLDNRYHKLDEETMFGRGQMRWLKKKLVESKANFKFIVSGSQLLTSSKNGENLGDFPEEKEELFSFIKNQDISGVVFLNGDRHFSELNFQYRTGTYPLHEFTCSPLTSFANPVPTIKNPLRVKKTLVRKRNFGRITISGERNDRICKMEVFDSNGVMLWSYSIDILELQ